MAANTIKLYHNLINPALELAVDSDIIRKNPAKDCKKGIGGTKKEIIAMTINEQEKLLNFIKFFHKRYKIPLLQNEDIHKYPLYQHFIKFSHNFSTHLLTVLTKSVIVISQVEQSVLK